jgi:hypothetical protein
MFCGCSVFQHRYTFFDFPKSVSQIGCMSTKKIPLRSFIPVYLYGTFAGIVLSNRFISILPQHTTSFHYPSL